MFYLPIGHWLSNLDLSLIIFQILAGFGIGSFGQLLVESYKWKVPNSEAHVISVYDKFKGASLELLTAFISLSPIGSWFSGFFVMMFSPNERNSYACKWPRVNFQE